MPNSAGKQPQKMKNKGSAQELVSMGIQVVVEIVTIFIHNSNSGNNKTERCLSQITIIHSTVL